MAYIFCVTGAHRYSTIFYDVRWKPLEIFAELILDQWTGHQPTGTVMGRRGQTGGDIKYAESKIFFQSQTMNGT